MPAILYCGGDVVGVVVRVVVVCDKVGCGGKGGVWRHHTPRAERNRVWMTSKEWLVMGKMFAGYTI